MSSGRSREPRQADRDDVDPIEEVVAEAPCATSADRSRRDETMSRAAEGMRRDARRGAGTSSPAARAGTSPAPPERATRPRRDTRCRPSATSSSPRLAATAPVNAPRSCPKSSLSKSSSERFAASMRTNGLGRAVEASWIARARRSLPVPLSPRIRMVDGQIHRALERRRSRGRAPGCRVRKSDREGTPPLVRHGDRLRTAACWRPPASAAATEGQPAGEDARLVLGVAPEPLERVEAPRLLLEDVEHDVAVVHRIQFARSMPSTETAGRASRRWRRRWRGPGGRSWRSRGRSSRPSSSARSG